MKNTFQRMVELPDFAKFIREFCASANYQVARTADPDQRDALLLCMAYAFEAGLESGKGNTK